MPDGALWFVVIVLPAVVVVLAFVVYRVFRLRCPACRKSLTRSDERTRSAKTFRCRACRGEFRRQDGGPLIAKAAWDAGARDALPQAKVHR